MGHGGLAAGTSGKAESSSSLSLLSRRLWPFTRLEYRLMALAVAGLVADVGVKTTLAPTYGLWLRQMARHAAPALYSGAFRAWG